MSEGSPLQLYLSLLQKWNRQINLTAIDDEEGFRTHHVDDARALLPHLFDARRVIDLGTGAGIPGIVLKIFRPDLDVTLLDATRKKISFCAEAIRQLGLANIRTVWGRAEDERLARAVGKYDLVVSRATWNLSRYLPAAILYMKEGSRCIAMKGPTWREELSAAAQVLKGSLLALEGTHPYALAGGEERCLVVFALRQKA